jgi:hypothetical protein
MLCDEAGYGMWLLAIRAKDSIISFVPSTEPFSQPSQTRRKEAFRIYLRLGPAHPPMPFSLTKRFNVFETRQHEPQEAKSSIPARLTDTQKRQVVPQTPLVH